MQLTDKIWLVGKTGRIGSALDYAIRHSDKAERLISTNREDIDTTDLKEVERFIQTHRPAIIINCAAKRDKLWCEENSDEAFRINSLGARNLAIASLETGAHLIHISSDYVFDGMTRKSYKEYSATNPINTYGKSMRFAEELINQTTARHTIIRASRLYGERLIRDIIDEATETGRVHFDEELTTSPVSSISLSELVLSLIDTSEYGTFHLGSTDIATAREFIEEILRIKRIQADLLVADDNWDIVQRPKQLVFSRTMLKLTGYDIEIGWKEDLRRFIEAFEI